MLNPEKDFEDEPSSLRSAAPRDEDEDDLNLPLHWMFPPSRYALWRAGDVSHRVA
jgi:hypothetical protein